MVFKPAVKIRLKDYKPWQIGLAGSLALTVFVMGLRWCMTPAPPKMEMRPRGDFVEAQSRETGVVRPTFRQPDFEPTFAGSLPSRPAKAIGLPTKHDPAGAAAQADLTPPAKIGPPVPQNVMHTQSPLMPSLKIPGAIPGSLPEMALNSLPGIPPSPDQLSPKFLKTSTGFAGPNPFAMMPRGAAPDPEIFARLPQVEMPRPPVLPAMPAPPKSYLDKINEAIDEARRRLAEPHPGEAPPAHFTEPAPNLESSRQPRELPQG